MAGPMARCVLTSCAANPGTIEHVYSWRAKVGVAKCDSEGEAFRCLNSRRDRAFRSAYFVAARLPRSPRKLIS